MAIHQEQTQKQCYNAANAAQLLKYYLNTQQIPQAQAQVYTLITNATAVQASMNTYIANWSNLP